MIFRHRGRGGQEEGRGEGFAPSVDPRPPYRARTVPLFPSFTPWARRSAHIRPPSSSTTPRVLSDPQGVGARPCLLYRPPTIREVGRTRPSAFVEAHTAYLFVRVLPSLQKESGYPLLEPTLIPFSPTAIRSLALCSDIARRRVLARVALSSHYSEENKKTEVAGTDFSEPPSATDGGCTMGMHSPKGSRR